MADKEMLEVIRELMNKYNEYRQKWIESGRDESKFDEWFTKQVMQ